MKLSWAAMVKKTPPAPAVAVASSTTGPAQQQQQGDIFILLPPKIQTKKNASGGVPEKQQKEEKEETSQPTAAEPIKPIERPQPQHQDDDDDPNSYPAHVSLTRPGAPTVAPIFKNNEEMQEWQKNEYNENHKYSNQIHFEKVQAWRQRVNWHIVPNMTSITPEEKALGFIKVHKPYYQVDEETRISTLNPTFPLPPDYHWQSQLHQFTPEAALWTMSTKANMWPGKTFAPRPDGCRGLSGSASALAQCGIKKTPKYEVHGVERGETGICNVKDFKTLGKKAPIRWYVSPTFLKNLKKFQFIFEENPNARDDYDSDDWFGDW